MSQDMAKHAVKVLTNNFGKQFPAKGMQDIWQEMCDAPDLAITAAVDFLCLNTNYLPTPMALIGRIRQESKRIASEESKQREAEWNKQKGGDNPRDIRRAGSIFSQEQQDRHARYAVQAILLMISDAPREEKLNCFREMENSYPGIGWAEQGMQLQKEWRRTGRMSEPSRQAAAAADYDFSE